MKAILFFLLCGLAFCQPFWIRPELGDSAVPTASAPPSEPDSVSFAGQIQPILQTRCNPCHFPGGKMYASMPFDRPETITGHAEGILKRIDDKAENKLLRQFLQAAGSVK